MLFLKNRCLKKVEDTGKCLWTCVKEKVYKEIFALGSLLVKDMSDNAPTF